MSQGELATAIGVTFQQVQKYESGHNRFSASRLWLAALALKVDVERFYDGLSSEVTDVAGSDDLNGLGRAAARLSVEQQRLVLRLVRSMADVRPSGPSTPAPPGVS